MNKSLSLSKVQSILLPGLLFLAVLLFYGLCYPHHLHFQEQYQLFLYDGGYVAEILAIPGGVADWIGRFLTQFFLLAWVGATIIAVLLTGIFLLSLRETRAGWFQGLSLLPAIVLWVFYCDENALLGGAVAFLLVLLANWGLSSVRHASTRQILRLIAAPVLYWALGPISVICGLLGLVSACRTQDKREIMFACVALVLLLLMPVVAHCWVALPMEQLWFSPHYYRYPTVIPNLLWVAVLCIPVLSVLPATDSHRKMSLVVWLLVVGAGGFAVKSSYNKSREMVMAYDFMARYQQWNRIIETANQQKPNNALSCATLNLALGMRGQLADRMFEYNQNGVAGLLPDFVRDPVGLLPTSEVYYQLGLINTAQRFVFEAQEAILDFQKSGRCYKRLAETNLICGNYEVARKYLQVLSKTLFYREWAQETMALLYNEEAIAKHKEYGRLRSMLPDQDYIFHDRDIAQLLGRQVLANGKNRLAYEYLQGAYLLQRDLDSFVNCLGLASEVGYLQMPVMFQQAYVLWWSQNHTANEKTPEFLNPNTIKEVKQFIALLRNQSTPKEQLNARFGKTYWMYYIK